MKVLYSWLKEFVDLDDSADVIAQRLTAAGMKVERIHRLGEGLEGVVVGKVVNIEPHPNADKLIVAEVDAGDSRVSIVCGASNFSVGDLVPVARAGARLPEIGVLEARKFRGVMSQGMLCSAAELGAGPDHSGILVLPADSTVGNDVREILGGGDTVLELEITPNRPDAMSLIGIAREVAACTGAELKETPIALQEAGSLAESLVTVRLEDSKGCPRYIARVIEGLSVGPSPEHVQRRLSLSGIRPISNVVDATNYALLITGHPMHAFDLEQLSEATIVIRRAAAGERLTAIDGSQLKLDPDDVVIADTSRVVALAGIMGGRETEVSDATSTVVLESAYFDPAAVFRASQRHLLRTESSSRFERGADPNNVDFAADLAASLILQWAGGKLAQGRVDIYPDPIIARSVSVRPPRANRLLGTSMEISEMAAALQRLGLEPAIHDDVITVAAPTRRHDLVAEEDLVEEIARVIGYENIPATLPTGPGRIGALSRNDKQIRRLKMTLAASGFFEARSSILIGPRDFEWSSAGAVATRLSNPLSEEESVLRGSLLPGLVRSVGRNFARRNTEVRLFEIGNVFVEAEAPRLGMVVGGHEPQRWFAPARAMDFYDLKGAVESLGEMLALGVLTYRPAPGSGPYYGPESAEVAAEEKTLGTLGRISDEISKKLGLEYPVYCAELDLTSLLDLAGREATPRAEAARYPAVLLDLAVTVPEEAGAADVAATAMAAAGHLLESIRLIDVYRGEQVGPGRKSLALSMVFRLPDRTLKDEEALNARDAAAAAIISRHGGSVRT